MKKNKKVTEKQIELNSSVEVVEQIDSNTKESDNVEDEDDIEIIEGKEIEIVECKEIEIVECNENENQDITNLSFVSQEGQQKIKRLKEFKQANTANHSFWKKVEDNLRQDEKVFQTGQFTPQENRQLKKNWDKLTKDCPFENPRVILKRLVYKHLAADIERFIGDTKFYTNLGHKINRSPYSVYVRARKMFNMNEKSGKYTEEEVKQLKQLEYTYVNRWEEIGRCLGRSGHSAFKKANSLEKEVKKGAWTSEEQQQLDDAYVEVMMVKKENKSEDEDGDGGSLKTDTLEDDLKKFNAIPWREIARLVPTRNGKQCRERWISRVRTKPESRRTIVFNEANQLSLVQELIQQSVPEESRVDWEVVQTKFPEILSLQYLKLKWYRIKNKISDHKLKTFQETLEAALDNIVLRSSSKLITSKRVNPHSSIMSFKNVRRKSADKQNKSKENVESSTAYLSPQVMYPPCSGTVLGSQNSESVPNTPVTQVSTISEKKGDARSGKKRKRKLHNIEDDMLESPHKRRGIDEL